MERGSREEEGKGSGEETHRSCQFFGQAQRNQEQPQPETGGTVSNMGSLGSGVLRLSMGSLGSGVLRLSIAPDPFLLPAPTFSAMT